MTNLELCEIEIGKYPKGIESLINILAISDIRISWQLNRVHYRK